MKASNKSLTINALILIIVSFMFTSMSVVFSEEKEAQNAVSATEENASKDGVKKKKESKGSEDEEPECD